jgi:glycosyltransferase involved in cell wall biosynthesis
MEKSFKNMKKPIIHAYFICYNEATILPHLLRHYLNFCDKVCIIDNFSTDNSVNIVNSFKNTEVLSYNSNNELRDDIYIQVKNSVWKRSVGVADYVIVGDTDEFLYHEDIQSYIQKAYDNGITIFKPKGYHMVGDEDLDLRPNDNIFEKVTQGVQTDVLNKMMMFDCNKIKDINYSFGCHMANPVGEVKLLDDGELKMCHYKFLGINDHLYKNNIRRQRLSEFNKQYGLGTYYLFTDEQAKEDYMGYLNKREKVF